ncbi:MAG: BCAM0308 family protein [Rhodospirillales bacterium]|nr:BCAM0308 family protein [Rhodospirillales bacterium]MDH3917317.1 BCAM0308 family protein [Rhodospirillales bacterium]MDH3968495.1 BCAM0308 family protein [Rhodospirillales bacterium]
MKKKDVGRRTPRMDRRLREHVHDPYKTRLKLKEPTVCPECGAVFHQGRWQWAAHPPADANEEMCQACHRTQDKYPAGTATLAGGFLDGHKEEILNLVRHQEDLEKGEHPLHRIISIEEEAGRIVVSTTDIHLPRRIGEAVHHAYQGDLDLHYEEEAYFLRVNWTREN